MFEQQQARAGATTSAGRVGASAVSEPPGLYRPRRPETTTFYKLLEQHFDDYLYAYEQRYEPSSGPLRAVVKTSVEAYLACGRPEGGFARLKCPSCRAEHILAFSCRTRNFCPSCQAKRAALFAEKLVDDILAPVPHRHYVFTIPVALRGLFQRDRGLLGLLSRSAYDAVKLCFEQVYERKDVRPGCIVSLQSFGSYAANFNPHAHCLITEGVFTRKGQFLPLRALDTKAIEEVFRRLVLARLNQAERLSEGFMRRLLSWSPSGFSLYAEQLVARDDKERLSRLARYITRAPVRLKTIDKLASGCVRVTTPPDPRTGQCERTLDVLDWIHAITTQIPAPRQHVIRYLGAYACRNHTAPRPQRTTEPQAAANRDDDTPFVKARRASWARLLRKIFEVDPLLCRCGAQLQIVSVITETDVVERILRHLRSAHSTVTSPYQATKPRAPPD